ncbi:helix-turn-helix transcriptional regulator [Paenibacillus sp. IB182496]|uniref:Helix-turn-helix transcriptional regulator n=1 Tax=Paenibacillus sabuli TaxID=2772509 RepID=A0A927BXN7_9BACL|nr:helix-turn-helix domain-containing protein [Paenibacillus sabuli]MBD2847806.1 helix-turn-helix transcriptional regulator [Paenibacillus sabuli]
MLTENYHHALQVVQYKIVFGHGSIIAPERVSRHLDCTEIHVSPEIEARLIEGIKKNDHAQMQTQLERYMAEVARFKYDHMVHALIHLVIIIKTAIEEINAYSVRPLRFDLGAVSRQVLDRETLEEIHVILQEVCAEIHESQQNKHKDKYALLVASIKEIVQQNYKDPNLGLQAIADMLGMTSAYVGRIFKQHELKSLAQYIVEVRLSQAAEWLEKKNFTIKEIMSSIGFVNESTFFKLFKKQFGVTPKEYRSKKKEQEQESH